jgi:hypothetical protein
MKAFATQMDSTVTAIDFSHCNVHSHSYTTNDVKNRLVYIFMLVVDLSAEETFLSMFLMCFLMDLIGLIKSKGWQWGVLSKIDLLDARFV